MLTITVNMARNSQVTLPFSPETARYRLPLMSGQGVLHIAGIELKNEPNAEEERRGDEYLFYPVSLLTGMERYHPEYDKAWFYALEVSKDALGRMQYELIFYDSKAELMRNPPEREFICHFYGFEQNGFEQNQKQLEIGEICQAGENIPEVFQLKNITPTSQTYPPVVDSHRHWDLLSHYAVGSYLLETATSVKQLLLDFDLYADTDRSSSRNIRRMIGGITNIEAKWGDRLIRDRTVRCLLVTLILDETSYTDAGEMYRFANSLYQFFPFCLAQGTWLRMRVLSLSSETEWYLSPSMIQGYRSIM